MNKKNSGFTLIEIVMVLVLLGILAAVAAPKYFDLQEKAEYAEMRKNYFAYILLFTILAFIVNKIFYLLFDDICFILKVLV